MRIIAVRQYEGPSGDYRIRLPMEYLRRRGHDCRVIQARHGMAWSPGWFVDYDACIWQGGTDPAFFEMIDCIPEDRRPRVIYECDDLLWEVPITYQASDEYRRVRLDVLRCIKGAGLVTCSTPELAERASRFNQNVKVILNAIDFEVRDWEKRIPRCPRHEVIIGWAGGIRPSGDVQVIGTALRDVLLGHPEAAFCIAGDEEQTYEFAAILQVPEEQLYVLPLATFDSYPQLLSAFDIGIAPLETNSFNQCKSELKLIEYGAWNIPYVASKVAPYERFHRRTFGCGGRLASTVNAWRKGLEALVSSADERRVKGRAGHGEVKRLYDMGHEVKEWEAAIRSVAREGERIAV